LTSPPKGLWHEISIASRSFQVIARPIENGPAPKGWVLVVRDVTQQREFERRARQQERLAAIGQLTAGIAHDFNNIMAVITLYANISLRTPDLPEKMYERMTTIDEQARRASDLIQQLMDFSRRTVLERSTFDLLAFLKEQVKLFERTLPENIRFDLAYDSDVYTIDADPTRIQQVIMNLATNARDAMPEGGQLRFVLKRIRVGNGKGAPLPEMALQHSSTPLGAGAQNPESGDWICLTVADTGCGIPVDVLPHIFDPFFTTKSPGSGTGLGLSQVYGIITQHQGHIDVSTMEGEGTTFNIYLPALPTDRSEQSCPKTQYLPQGQGQVILVVEDEDITRKAVVSGLEMLGYRVLEADDGREALKVFEQHASQIDLVLSDMVMPNMGGRALFQALKQLDADGKVVLMTGHPLEEGELGPLLAQGLQGWLTKPPSLEQLALAVARALEGKGPHE
jgi:signal transduction histidine kinase/ActR/RegA family two-component response regulator